MTTAQFLEDLEKELKGRKIPRKDIEAAREFYDEAIADRIDSGMSEDEAIADLGSIEEIALTTYEENPPIKKTIAGMSVPMLVLFIVLTLLSSVIWGPVVLVALIFFVLFALMPLGTEALFIVIGGFFIYLSALAFSQGHANLTVWFLVFIGLGILGISIALTPLTYRVAELAGRASAHGAYYLSQFFSTRTRTRKISWYRPVFKLRKFDKIVLIASGIIAGIGILGAFAIWASVGFNVGALPAVEPILFHGESVTIDITDLHIGTD
ncbi:MAG: DUF1700 domain-containing protein [Actinomycetaceae bacterium]|nr:DUF1700 domain-containing protein [Actinomycetaceae bacterium]